MYDPTVGRFITEDPIGFAGRDTNLYRYVGNSPTNATDPTGLAENGPPVPAEPEHGFLWWLWNTISTWAAPPPVVAAEGAPHVASGMMNNFMAERAERIERQYGGPNSPEAKYAWQEYEKAKEGKLREFHQQNAPPPPRSGFPPFVPAGCHWLCQCLCGTWWLSRWAH
jgi:hypothetical protein